MRPKLIESAREAGFEITLIFVGVDEPAINIERVRTRVRLGGHDVPEDRVVSRYHRTMGFLLDMVERVDRTVVFDNTVQSADPLAFHGRVGRRVYFDWWKDHRHAAIANAGVDKTLPD